MKNNEHRQALVDTLNGALEGLDEENTQAARDMVDKWRRELADFDAQHPETDKLKDLLRQRDKLREVLKACEEALSEVPCLSNKQESSRIQARAVLSETEETI